MSASLQELLSNICADQRLFSNFQRLRELTCQRILQDSSPEPVFSLGAGGDEERLLAHLANSALEALEENLAEVGPGKLSLQGQDLYKLYRTALYRLRDAGLLPDAKVDALMRGALNKINNR